MSNFGTDIYAAQRIVQYRTEECIRHAGQTRTARAFRPVNRASERASPRPTRPRLEGPHDRGGPWQPARTRQRPFRPGLPPPLGPGCTSWHELRRRLGAPTLRPR
jgi:hypothetical protein